MFQLFKSFFLIGLGAYGGGLVVIPLIQHEIVNKQGWLDLKEMASLLAISQMTPGPIAINAATFVGFQTNGFWGALLASLSVILPSVIILSIMAPVIDKSKNNIHVRMLREGFQMGVLSLILFAVWSYGNAVISNLLELAVGTAAFIILVIFEGKMHPIYVILGCGILGLLIF
ncbi:MAG: chromate transporter [Candidatus Cloacimonetes bacterium]|nr:chromate transporter [Candidatus Cloacimonadota bacterium]